MTKEKSNPPKLYPLKALPKFVQIAVADMWEKNGTSPEDLNLVCTYFDGIYSARPINTAIFKHECVHYVRQGNGLDENRAKEYVLRYVSDPKFRYEEELLAYREQYRFILINSNKPVAFEHAKIMAGQLSGPMYGSLCSFQKALSDILFK